MAFGLLTGAENCQRPNIRSSRSIDKRRRNSSGSHLGDQPAVHSDERLPRRRIEKRDQRHVRVKTFARVSGIERDELRANCIRRDRRHAAKVSAVLVHVEDSPRWLLDATRRIIDHRLPHSRDQICHRQYPRYFGVAYEWNIHEPAVSLIYRFG